MRQEAGWAQNRSVCCVEKNVLPLPRIKPPDLDDWAVLAPYLYVTEVKVNLYAKENF
jgi:hypothetical protein